MKKLLLITAGAWMLWTASMKAQITLEHVFDSTYAGDLFYCTDIGDNDFKYIFLNYNNSFSIYNMDMSPYLTNIQIPTPGDSIIHGFTVMYITKTLFDCDSSNIEYAYENPYILTKPFRILRTDGTLLLELDSANSPYGFGVYGGSIDWRPIKKTSAGTKLFIQRNPNNNGQILVYDLCGELPVDIINMYDLSENRPYIRLFPNPADRIVNFKIKPPNNFDEFKILIFNAEFRLLESLANQVEYSLNVSNYNSGTYFYSLIGKNKVYQTGKFVLTK